MALMSIGALFTTSMNFTSGRPTAHITWAHLQHVEFMSHLSYSLISKNTGFAEILFANNAYIKYWRMCVK